MNENHNRAAMMKKNLGLIVFISAVIVFLTIISGKRAAPLPGDAAHARSIDASSCGICHSRGKQAPVGKTHPQNEQCLTCHTRSKDCHPWESAR